MVDESRRLTVRNRRHLRKIPDPVNVDEPRKEAHITVPARGQDAHGLAQPAPSGGPAPVPRSLPETILLDPVPLSPNPDNLVPLTPIPDDPVPLPPDLDEPAPQPPLTLPAGDSPPLPSPSPTVPRRSSRATTQPRRLEMRMDGKTHGETAQTVRHNRGGIRREKM